MVVMTHVYGRRTSLQTFISSGLVALIFSFVISGLLTRRHKRRRPRRSRPSRDTIKDRVSIHERPKKVDARTEGGHWEGDLIICKRTRPVLVLHERKSRVTLAVGSPERLPPRLFR